MKNKKKVLLFSTLNPYPFWAGSENFWYDFVKDQRVYEEVNFTCSLAKSPLIFEKAKELAKVGIPTITYNHFNVSFARRNVFKLLNKTRPNSIPVLPWYNTIKREKPDLVWFNVAGLDDLLNLRYPVSLCKKLNIPYWLILQHGFEDFFLTTKTDIEIVTEVSCSAKRFIFIADRNRLSLERAIGLKLPNAVRSVNSISHDKILRCAELNAIDPPSHVGKARFFNLGRFSPKDKAQHLLVEVLSGQQWKNRDWQLSFIGVSDFGEYYLRRMANYFGLDPSRIKTIPFTNNVFEAIVKEDVLLMPSVAEGTPYAMIESMACGRPALGTPVGGIPELIKNRVDGWLTNGHQINDISDKMEEVWADRNKWKEFGENARKQIESSYDQQTAHPALLKLLLEDIHTV